MAVLMVTKKAGSKLATEAVADLSTELLEDLDQQQAMEEDGPTREERTSMTTEMLTQKHSHKYILLALKEKLVKMT